MKQEHYTAYELVVISLLHMHVLLDLHGIGVALLSLR